MPPLSPHSVLLTIYQGRSKDLKGVLEPCDDASLEECVAATMFILWTLRIDFTDFQNFLYRMGSDCCARTHGMLIVAKIRLVPGGSIPEVWYKNQKKEEKPTRRQPKKEKGPVKSLF